MLRVQRFFSLQTKRHKRINEGPIADYINSAKANHSLLTGEGERRQRAAFCCLLYLLNLASGKHAFE
jgi:hypothetical protein